MKSLKYAISYGFLVWLLPFVFSVLIFFLHEAQRSLFESLMGVFGVLMAVIFTNLYFRKVEISLREGIFLGIVWVIISFSFDFLFFIVGPARMSIPDYIKDIGVSYLAIPIITVGFSFLRSGVKDKE